jgi:hypothetical protein
MTIITKKNDQEIIHYHSRTLADTWKELERKETITKEKIVANSPVDPTFQQFRDDYAKVELVDKEVLNIIKSSTKGSTQTMSNKPKDWDKRSFSLKLREAKKVLGSDTTIVKCNRHISISKNGFLVGYISDTLPQFSKYLTGLIFNPNLTCLNQLYPILGIVCLVLIPEPFINQTFLKFIEIMRLVYFELMNQAMLLSTCDSNVIQFANSFYERVGHSFASDFSYEKFIRSLIGQLNQQSGGSVNPKLLELCLLEDVKPLSTIVPEVDMTSESFRTAIKFGASSGWLIICLVGTIALTVIANK